MAHSFRIVLLTSAILYFSYAVAAPVKRFECDSLSDAHAVSSTEASIPSLTSCLDLDSLFS
ncbi:hypothetical protein QCA50_015581 [Cerrena zonata]|uniref:Uncharacterized protein n=1 Tax=Cerrena zonata TaxID=2478898 RepID=A0AAW0FTB3_9APHY